MAAEDRGLEGYELRGDALAGPGFDLVERVARTCLRRKLVETTGGKKIVVGASGGPDSTCLLDVMRRLIQTFRWDLVVAHVDHGLAAASEEIAARVSRDAAAEGFEVHVIRAPDLGSANLQAKARDFRYEFFATVAANTGAEGIATAHTLDDRVETTIARLIHGAGTEGLAGMRPRDGDRIRPLIEIRRAETRAYCDDRGLWFHDDPANEDRRFDRVAVRHDVVAAIERRWGDGAIRAMATSADRLDEDAAFLHGLGETLYGQLARRRDDGIVFELDALRVAPRPLRRRLLERAVGRLRDRAAAIDDVLDALERPRRKVPARFSVSGGGEIVIDSDVLVVAPGAGSARGDTD